MRTKYIYLLLLLLISFSCTDLEPKLDAAINDSDVWKDRDFSVGVLNDAYKQLSAFYSNEFGAFLDCATDNAVTNNYASGMITMATGGWTSSSNPLDSWQKCYKQIRNLNRFIQEMPNIEFSNDPAKNTQLAKRVKGEAYFLRAWYQFELLSRFSGLDEKGNLLGYPVVLKPLSDEELKSKPRNTFDQCVEVIEEDLDSALVHLPPTQYTGSDVVLGATQTGRAYKLAALSLRSRLSLYAASPAYTVNKTDLEKQLLWEKAAVDAMAIITEKGTLPAINVNGDLFTNPNHAEIIWRSYQPDSNGPEHENFIPSLWGNGRTNPSQQLVDAFPMKDGYPISESTEYESDNPYSNRDNRFILAIAHNDANFGGTKVELFTGGKDNENHMQTRVSRTGYYLRKFIDPNVVITPGEAATTTKHYYAFFRWGEIWLNFAEAANEAWGTDSDPLSLGKTAKSALGELRKRAGIANADLYLESQAAAGEEALRRLIYNERRIELCFENHRFFDQRRWLTPLSELNQEIRGVKITKDNAGLFKYDYDQKVEIRKFSDYMYYGPLPEQVIYTSNGAIKQNAGW